MYSIMLCPETLLTSITLTVHALLKMITLHTCPSYEVHFVPCLNEVEEAGLLNYPVSARLQ